MNNNKDPMKRISDELINITKQGIQADKARLKKDMKSQFSNYREYIRELVTNAYDARASWCRIHGEAKDDIITIHVLDNGNGMNRDRVRKFFTLYTSEKDMESSKAIGTHGIGKLSIAAIPNQLKFEMITSTGKEAWHAITGALDGEEDIEIDRVKDVPPKGTHLQVSFKKSCSLLQEMNHLKDILNRYVRYLPIQVYITVPVSEKNEYDQIEYPVSEEWGSDGFHYLKSYKLTHGLNEYEVQLGLGSTANEVYQNLVFITSRYNLVSFDLNTEWELHGLMVRVNGNNFELPFGRHCLSDESVLKPITRNIRVNLLPRFMELLYINYQENDLNDLHISGYQVDAITCCLFNVDKTPSRPWNNYPLIMTIDLGKISFNELAKQVKEKGKFYIQDEENNGIDYEYIDAPVLHHNQPGNVIELVKDHFKEQCVLLKSEDLVFELPASKEKKLSDLQKSFEENLGFHPEILSEEPLDFLADEHVVADRTYNDDGSLDPFMDNGFCREIEDATLELKNIKWRVNYLVEKDFETPCLSRLFLYANGTVTLNLYHPQIQKLVELTKINPKLAGHWGVSLCLEDGRNIFPYLNAETREDLLMLDGIAKLSAGGTSKNIPGKPDHFDRLFRDFRKNINDSLSDQLN